MQAIILAGGFGTRLRTVLTDVPKPMAPINGKPFLAYLLDYLKLQGITDVVLSVHYLKEQIENYFQNKYADINISYAVEAEALGTGGAILNSLPLIDKNKPVFVLNGDTFLKLNYRAMFQAYDPNLSLLAMALRQVEDCQRYGVVSIETVKEKYFATQFAESGGAYPGLINAGIYLLQPELFNQRNLPKVFSFERDFLFPNIPSLRPQVLVVDDYFIDIGVPEDYARSIREL